MDFCEICNFKSILLLLRIHFQGFVLQYILCIVCLNYIVFQCVFAREHSVPYIEEGLNCIREKAGELTLIICYKTVRYYNIVIPPLLFRAVCSPSLRYCRYPSRAVILWYYIICPYEYREQRPLSPWDSQITKVALKKADNFNVFNIF